ncbi:hypothetical protein ACTA71_006474 [Dictyostelium dimigraforme]
MKIIIILIILLFNSIDALPSILDCQYQKQGYTLPPTTIYYFHSREQFGKISRNDITNNSRAIYLFGSTNILGGQLLTVTNNETVLLSMDLGEFSGETRFIVQKDYTEITLFDYIEGGWIFNSLGDHYLHDSSITFDDCSKDYFNITAWTFIGAHIHIVIASSLDQQYMEFINTTANFDGGFNSFYDKISMVYYLFGKDDRKHQSNLIIADIMNRSSSKYSIEYKENRSVITAFKNSLYMELEYEISNIIPSENPSYFIVYSNKSQVLIVYNIDNSSYEKYTNFRIPLVYEEGHIPTFIARGGSPIEPNQEKKKNILIPILISIIGFSVIVFLIIITILFIKRRNIKNSDKIYKQKDNESEIQKNKN